MKRMIRRLDWDLLNETVTDALRRYSGDHAADRMLDSILDAAVWQWTERLGKYTPGYATLGAIRLQTANRTGVPRLWQHTGIQHEHVVEKRWIKDQMKQAGNASPLLAHSVACIVTKEEHRRIDDRTLPRSHGWVRYYNAGIHHVVKQATGEQVDVLDLAEAAGHLTPDTVLTTVHPVPEDLSEADYGVNGVVDGSVIYEGVPGDES